MPKKLLVILFALISLSVFANQSVNTNPGFNQPQNNDKKANDGSFPSEPDNDSNMPPSEKDTQPTSNTILDLKTTHGSVMITKIFQKTAPSVANASENTQKNPADNELLFKPKTDQVITTDTYKISETPLSNSKPQLKK